MIKKLIFAMLFFLCAACSSPPKKSQLSVYESDFKTSFQAALSALKDRRFVIKSYDWNSGEIDAYLIYENGTQKKEVNATVSVEQSGSKVKIRMVTRKSEKSPSISDSDLSTIEKGFFQTLDEAFLKK